MHRVRRKAAAPTRAPKMTQMRDSPGVSGRSRPARDVWDIYVCADFPFQGVEIEVCWIAKGGLGFVTTRVVNSDDLSV